MVTDMRTDALYAIAGMEKKLSSDVYSRLVPRL